MSVVRPSQETDPRPDSTPQAEGRLPAPAAPSAAEPASEPEAKPERKKFRLFAPAPVGPIEPIVTGESQYDRVSSALISVLLAVTGIAIWLGVLVYTQQTRAEKPLLKMEIIEVYGGGGGSPDGNPGETDTVEVSGAEAGDVASNNMEDAAAFEDPTIETTTSSVIDALADVPPDQMSDIDVADAVPNGEMVATGKRTSKIGTGKAFGFGPGPGGGVPREQRWSIVFNPGQTPDEYARQLDFFKVELATPESAGTLTYGSNFSSPTPTRRSGLAGADKRLYFLWQGAGRKSSDMELLQKAGVNVGNKPIFQFYPPDVEEQLSQLEYHFAQRQPAQIRKTRFHVLRQGNGYVLQVHSQDPMYEAAN